MNDRGGVVAAASWPGAAQPVQKLHYDGTIGALYGIFIKNLLLSIITLTIYRFWGKTNLRRYAWSHTSLQGQRFEYTGRGGELFIGFLIVAAIYAVIAIGISILSLTLGEVFTAISPFFFIVLAVYLVLVAQYAAQNYRLTRTLWSGIRGGMTGSAWKYGVKAFLLTLLNILTLNLAAPWTHLRLAEDRFNNSYFGNAKASLQTSAGRVYGPFLLGILINLAGIAVLAGLGWVVLMGSGLGAEMMSIFQELTNAEAAGREANLTEEQSSMLFTFMVVGVLTFYVGIALIAIVSFAPYAAALFREIASNLQLAELRFESKVTTWNYVGLWIGNLLWVVLTLGLGFPVAVHRSLRFFADRVAIHGSLDLQRLQQTSLDRPKFGEGLLEAFDPGFF